jgi:hypothetical protein
MSPKVDRASLARCLQSLFCMIGCLQSLSCKMLTGSLLHHAYRASQAFSPTVVLVDLTQIDSETDRLSIRRGPAAVRPQALQPGAYSLPRGPFCLVCHIGKV